MKIAGLIAAFLLGACAPMSGGENDLSEGKGFYSCKSPSQPEIIRFHSSTMTFGVDAVSQWVKFVDLKDSKVRVLRQPDYPDYDCHKD